MSSLYTDEEDPMDMLAQKSALQQAMVTDDTDAKLLAANGFTPAWQPEQDIPMPAGVSARKPLVAAPRPIVGGAPVPPQAPAPAVAPASMPVASPAPPTAPVQPTATHGPSMWGPGLEHQERSASPFAGFDVRRMFVAAGHGDVAAYDKAKREGQDREEAKRIMRARLDPGSPESVQAQTDFTAQLKAYSQVPGLPDGLKKQLDAMTANARGMSAVQIDKSLVGLQSLLGTTLKAADVESRTRRADQRERFEEAQIAQMGGKPIDWGRLKEETRHNQAMEGIAQEKADNALTVKVKPPPETTLRKYREISIAQKQIARLKELLPHVRYVGMGADEANAFFSRMPAGDPRNKAEIEFASLIKRLRAPERKNLFGAALSKFDIRDSEGFMAGLTNNRETLAANLQTLEDAIGTDADQIRDQYPTLAGEQFPAPPPKQTSAPSSPAAASPKASAAIAAPPGAPAGKTIRAPDGKRYKVSDDGKTMTEVH